MTRKLLTLLEDDLDGSEASETITFGLDGVTYEIDLKAKNAAKLRKVVEPYRSAARRLGRTTARTRPGARRRAAAGTKPLVDPAAVRAWAAANQIKVARRGRLSAAVIEQFRAAGY